jgi:hypothetical protein
MFAFRYKAALGQDFCIPLGDPNRIRAFLYIQQFCLEGKQNISVVAPELCFSNRLSRTQPPKEMTSP